jgi:glycosyl transferase family 25
MIPVYIINLEKDTDRYDFISGRLNKLEINHIRFPAIDGKRIAKDRSHEYEEFQSKRPLIKWTPSEMGCFLSHYNVWQKIADAPHNYGIVFEDDVHISQDLKVLLEDISWLKPEYDVINLEFSGNLLKLNGKLELPCKNRYLSKILPYNQIDYFAPGASAYILSKAAANKILQANKNLHTKVDHFLFYPLKSRIASTIEIYQINPALCIQDFLLIDRGFKGRGFKTNITKVPFKKLRKLNSKNLLRKLRTLYRYLQLYKKVNYIP